MRNWLGGFSIRVRITAGTLAIGLCVSAIAGVLLYVDVSSITRSSTIQLLHNDLAPLEVAIKHSPTDPDTRAGEGQLAAIVSPAGSVVVSNLPDSLRDQTSALERLHGDPTTIGSEKEAYLVMTEHIPTSAGTWTAIVARSLEPGDLVLRQLGTTILVGALVLFLSFGLASWLLSGAALRPVSRMRVEAERLGLDDTDTRLPVGAARDELAALATTLNQFLERNRQSIDRERQMISDASHELRTPLAVLVAQLDEAKRLSANPAAQSSELINAAHTAARLSRMTTNMLELSRLDAHRETATASQQELALELSQSTDRARIVGHPRDVSVDFEISENALGARFAISAVNFGGLVDNLFANAIAASGRRTAVRATLAFESGELRLAVIDEGVGMPEEFMPIAFDRFSRPEKARPTHDRGSGLGLSIVAKIVDRGGGQITLRNLVPGLGVFITLPAVAADSTGPEMPTRRGPST